MVLAKIRNRLEPLFLTILRVCMGFIMAGHGWMKYSDMEKWTGQLQSMGIPNPEIMAYLTVAGELLGGLGLLIGFLTPLASLGIAAVMVGAIANVHWPHGLWAKNNGFEYPLTILLVALYFMVKGAGPCSLDALLCRKCGRESAEI